MYSQKIDHITKEYNPIMILCSVYFHDFNSFFFFCMQSYNLSLFINILHKFNNGALLGHSPHWVF